MSEALYHAAGLEDGKQVGEVELDKSYFLIDAWASLGKAPKVKAIIFDLLERE